MILYKYRAINELTKKIFLERKIWLSKPDALNDPFECSINNVDNKLIENRIRQLISWKITDFIRKAEFYIECDNDEFYGLTKNETLNYIEGFKKNKTLMNAFDEMNSFLKQKTNEPIFDIFSSKDIFLNQLAEVGIFSLSETDTNQLLWSHYADNSKGITIGFNFSNYYDRKNHSIQFEKKSYAILEEPYEPPYLQRKIYKVEYSNNPNEIYGEQFGVKVERIKDEKDNEVEVCKLSFADPSLLKAIIRKPECWSYEKEWRYIEEKNGYFDYPTNIFSVTFGLNCPNNERSQLFEFINNLGFDIKFYQIEKNLLTNQFSKSVYSNK